MRIVSIYVYVNEYVGSDSATGTTTSTPFQTITKCLSVAMSGDSCGIQLARISSGMS